MTNIVLIGNGFDLAHNLPTSYNDFIKHLARKSKQKPNPNNLVTVLGTSINNSSLSYPNQGYIQKTESIKYLIESNNSFLIKICKEINAQNWCDIESLYFKELNKCSNDNIKILNKELNQIKIELEIYLSRYSNMKALNSFTNFFNSIPLTGETLCLNFNYTSLYENLYKHNDIKLINIHGELNNQKNPIIFGYAATEDENKALLSKGNNEFLKNIKTYHYNRTPIERYLNKYLRKNEELNVYVLGHSCGTADNNILNRILGHEKMRTIEIFYHNNYDNYFDTLINIRRVMSSNVNFDRVTEFENSFRCPQHVDNGNDTIQKKFNKILDKGISDARAENNLTVIANNSRFDIKTI